MTSLDTFTGKQVEDEEAEDRRRTEELFRPKFLEQPLEFEATWTKDPTDYAKTGTSKAGNDYSIACWAIELEDLKILKVTPDDINVFVDGGSFTWLINKPKPDGKLKNSDLGQILKAAGVDKLTDLQGQRLHFTETVMRPWPKADGSYLYKVTRVAGANGAKPDSDKEAKFKAAEETARVALESTAWESESAFRTAWLNNPAVNQISPDFNTEVMLSRWAPQVEHFKNLGTPAA